MSTLTIALGAVVAIAAILLIVRSQRPAGPAPLFPKSGPDDGPPPRE